MDKKNFLYISIGIIILILALSLSFGNDEAEFLPERSLELDFTYSDANSKLKEILESYNISMSSAIVLREPDSIERYCSFFDDENKQRMVEHCTSTELLDSDGIFLGNIHMVGSKKLPKIVLVLIQTDPFMQEIEEIKSVFNVAIENLVCNCWEEVKPSNFNNIDEWIDRHREFHTSATTPHSKSNLSLNGKQLQIELTTNNKGYLWKLIVSR